MDPLNDHGPVFVDPSGRRGRLVRRACWLLGSLAGAYVVAVLLALVVPAGLTRLAVPGLGAVLPGPAAPELRDAGGSPAPAAGLLAPSPTAAASVGPIGPVDPTAQPVGPSGPGRTVAPGGLASPVGPSMVAPVPTPSPGRGVASSPARPVPSAAPTRTSPPGRPSPTAASSPRPGITPPGQPRPRPSHSPRSRPSPTPSPGPR